MDDNESRIKDVKDIWIGGTGYFKSIEIIIDKKLLNFLGNLRPVIL
jgi:hypothetical protein